MLKTLRISTKRFTPFFVAFLFFITQVASTTAIALLNTGRAHAVNEISVSTHQGQLKDGTTNTLLGYTTGSSNITTYTELDSINFRFDVTSSSAVSGQMQVEFTSNDTGCLFFDGSFALGTHDSSAPAVQNISGVSPVVTTAGSATNNGNDWVQVLNFDFSGGAGSATINYYLTLTDEAGECSSGSPQHSRLANATGDNSFKNIGNQNIPIPAKNIIELPEIYIQKWVDDDADGQVDRKATAGEWSFSLDGGTPVPTDANGEVVFSNVTPDGDHTITESGGPTDQSFLNGSGTNCTFNGSTATANVKADTTAKDATCIFNNGQNPGSITIIKDAVPNDEQDFTFSATGNGVSGFVLDDDGDNGNDLSNTKVFNNLSAGQYVFTENAVAGWSFDGITCSQGSSVIKDDATVTVDLSAGQNVTCTYKNRKNGTITVNKVTFPADDPTLFEVTATGDGQILNGATKNVSTSQSAVYEVQQGTYSVAETVPAGWHLTDNTCVDVVVSYNDLNKTCTITNTKYGKITVIKDAVPNDPQDFVFNTTSLGAGTFTLDDDPSDGARTNNITFSSLLPGTYSVTEQDTPGWQLTGLNCGSYEFMGTTAQISLNAGEEVTCTFTNTKLLTISGHKYLVNADGSVTGNLNNWMINLLLDDGQTVVDSAYTGDNGYYEFTNLLYGANYFLQEVNKDGYTQITDTDTCPTDTLSVSLNGSENSTDNDFCNFKNGSISGYKFLDNNGDGVRQNNEQKLRDWVIQLYKMDSQSSYVQFDSTETNNSGNYYFNDLAPGSYAVCEVQQTGYVRTLPSGDDGCHYVVIDISGEKNEGMNFGNQARGTITVKKNVDNDGDGNVDVYGSTDWTWNLDPKYNNGTSPESNIPTDEVRDVSVGRYDISENHQDGYHLEDLKCYDGDRRLNVQDRESVEVRVYPGSNIICTFTNARDTGWIKVVKNVDPEYDRGKFNLLIDESVEASNVQDGGNTGYVRVVTGEHVVSETAGYHTDLNDYFAKISGDCDHDGEVYVKKNKKYTCVITNTKKSEIIVQKDAVPNDQQDFNFEIRPYVPRMDDRSEIFDRVLEQNDFEDMFKPKTHEFTLDDDWKVEGADNEFRKYEKVDRLNPGWYEVREMPVEGWDIYDIQCGSDKDDHYDEDRVMMQESRYEDDHHKDPYMTKVYVAPGQKLECKFTNVKRATITIVKDAQPDSEQEFSFSHNITEDMFKKPQKPELPSISLNEGLRFEAETPEDFTLVDDGVNEELSTKTFDDIKTGKDGRYFGISEHEVDGWIEHDFVCDNQKDWHHDEDHEDRGDDQQVRLQSVSEDYSHEGEFDHYFKVRPGENMTCTFVNQQTVINISKFNDQQPTPTVTGETVVYSLVVSVPQEAADVIDTVVTDLPPENFEYVPGSWTAESNLRGDLKSSSVTTEPTYASPGSWQLGTMVGGETVILTYLATIQDNVTPGIYPDIAFVQGLDENESEVLGNVTTSDTPFVGTDVEVVEPTSSVFTPPAILVETGSNLPVVLATIPAFLLGLTVFAYKRSRRLSQEGGQL